MSTLQVMLVAVGIVLMLMALGLVFVKIRRVHLATFRLVADVSDIQLAQVGFAVRTATSVESP